MEDLSHVAAMILGLVGLLMPGLEEFNFVARWNFSLINILLLRLNRSLDIKVWNISVLSYKLLVGSYFLQSVQYNVRFLGGEMNINVLSLDWHVFMIIEASTVDIWCTTRSSQVHITKVEIIVESLDDVRWQLVTLFHLRIELLVRNRAIFLLFYGSWTIQRHPWLT